jgi:hypothetical protein
VSLNSDPHAWLKPFFARLQAHMRKSARASKAAADPSRRGWPSEANSGELMPAPKSVICKECIEIARELNAAARADADAMRIQPDNAAASAGQGTRAPCPCLARLGQNNARRRPPHFIEVPPSAPHSSAATERGTPPMGDRAFRLVLRVCRAAALIVSGMNISLRPGVPADVETLIRLHHYGGASDGRRLLPAG